MKLRDIFLLALLAVFATPAHGQTVHIIFPFGAGNSADTLTRIIGEELGAGLGMPSSSNQGRVRPGGSACAPSSRPNRTATRC